ncbi:phage portal protein [Pseudoponticoccus marisrubri]|uniref:Phage portal protein n=1 Tax=Pseudoponticoccus marisrubri TaxID=1685382 RepID=A0A0W7WPD4_9RHOB|nr:phage portal protein [Pseudoponticoccus marisrubri]KUF12412.1 phage portal protein [Pseudoponticoccus marisrubri]
MHFAERLRRTFGTDRKQVENKDSTKALSLSDPAAFELFGAIATHSGLDIGPHSAMRVPAVACAVGLIADTVGTLPIKIYERGTKQTVSDHPAYRLAHTEANEWTSAAQLRTQLSTDALLHGSGYAQVVRVRDGAPYELHRLDPAAVQRTIEPTGEPVYAVTTETGTARLTFRDVVHVQPFGGASPIYLAREAIGLAIAFEKHMGGIFANGGRPSGIITAQKSLDLETKKRIAASWFSTHSRDNAGGTAILDEGMAYQQLAMTLADAQFAENRLEQIREIARAFRVPPTMLFELTRGTWSNTEEMARQFYSVTLKPWLAEWTWAYSRCLLTPEERADLYLEFVTDDLLTTDHASRATAYGQYRAMGAMTANEVRAGLNLPAHADGDLIANPYTTSDKDRAA